jgi:mannose-6-phosphate isomerase-like protein (cupin superfamily)
MLSAAPGNLSGHSFKNPRRRICLRPRKRNQSRLIRFTSSKHYTVDAENDRVRVIRARYGPHEKSVMHGHPSLVAVFLTSNNGRFTFPDGRTEKRSWKAGESMVMAAEEHLPENLSDHPLEVVLVELK